MLQECFKEFLRVCQGRLRGVWKTFKGHSREFEGYLKELGVSREFQIRFMEISGLFKRVLSMFQENSIKSLKCFSKMFQQSFVLLLCCCMTLIAATPAEGGLIQPN